MLPGSRNGHASAAPIEEPDDMAFSFIFMRQT
jgi:hypothetical protein